MTRYRLRIDHSMIDFDHGQISVSAQCRWPSVGRDGGGCGARRRGLPGWRRLAGGVRRRGRRVEPALGVDQEGTGRRHLLAGREPLEHREAVAERGPRTTLRPSKTPGSAST